MTEDARIARNRAMLQQLNPTVRTKLATVIARLQSQGYRPRIQQAWRSPEEQMAAFTSGHSELQFGFHNCSTSDGKPDALAADILDDDSPLEPRRTYLLALAREARAAGLDTGIEWGLPAPMRAALAAVIASGGQWHGKLGWDATHCQVTGLSVQQARNGARPSATTEANV